MKTIQSVYEYLIRSLMKQFLPKFHVSKGMKRSPRRAALESLKDRHMLSASTFVEVSYLSCETGLDAYVAQENPTSDGVVPDEFIPELRNQLIEETTQKTSKIYHFSRENNNWIFADISPNIDEFWG